MSGLSYAVLLAEPERRDPGAVAKALAAHRGIPFQDAARLAKGTWGIAGEELSEEEARKLVERLGEAGLKGLALPANLLVELPAPRPAAKAELEGEGLRAFLGPGEAALVPWSRLALIAAAGLQQTSVKTVAVKEGPTAAQQMANLGIMMATGLPIKVGGKENVVQKKLETSELVFFLDLYFGEPASRVRIDAQGFDYSCLKERMTHHVLGNFKTLALEISSRAPAAWASRGLDVLRKGLPVSTMGYGSLADLDRESRWLLTLRSLKPG